MEELLTLLQRKLIQLECYRDVTNRLSVEDIESFEELLDERGSQLEEYNLTRSQIEKAVAALPEADLIRLVFAGDEYYAGRFPQIAEISTKIRAVIEDIQNIDKTIRVRIISERDKVLALVESSEKTNRVANYMRMTNFDTTVGGSFNFKL
jgi:SMC interacting uncharacterized protein involved in chromosome segregation